MERLTHRYTDGEAWASIYKVCACGENECKGPIIDRLAAYEDTNMEPDEIRCLLQVGTTGRAVGGADGSGDASGGIASPQTQEPTQAVFRAVRGKRQNCFEEVFVGMTIKDIKAGQTVYILEDGRYRATFGTVTEAEVAKVGRKYVTIIEGRKESRFYKPVNSTTYLVEDKDYRVKRLLFLTTEAVDEYKELNDLRSWVQEATNWLKVKRYTLAQLREIKKILEGGDDT